MILSMGVMCVTAAAKFMCKIKAKGCAGAYFDDASLLAANKGNKGGTARDNLVDGGTACGAHRVVAFSYSGWQTPRGRAFLVMAHHGCQMLL
jgi:hypothetical protein